MTKSRGMIVSNCTLRTAALLCSRRSFGWRRCRLGDLIARARLFEAWLDPFRQHRDHCVWLSAKQALERAVEDSHFDRGAQRRTRAFDARTVLRRAEAYRVYVGVED